MIGHSPSFSLSISSPLSPHFLQVEEGRDWEDEFRELKGNHIYTGRGPRKEDAFLSQCLYVKSQGSTLIGAFKVI